MVQGSLDSLKQSNPGAYSQTISQINSALNPGTVGTAASNLFSTEKAYAGVLNGVRNDLGRNIDFIFAPEVQTALKIVAVQERTTLQALLAEGINTIFASRGKPEFGGFTAGS